MNDWSYIDKQMQEWSLQLCDDLKITPPESNSLASTIAREIGKLPDSKARNLLHGSEVDIKDRLDELRAFQQWMDFVVTILPMPEITRAQVTVECYICFLYLKDEWFKKLLFYFDPNTVTKKCCSFLTNDPVRAFRNAFAHGNWKYKSDFSGLEFWARKGSESDEPMERFEVSQTDLNFWQAIARCTAYVTLTTLLSRITGN